MRAILLNACLVVGVAIFANAILVGGYNAYEAIPAFREWITETRCAWSALPEVIRLGTCIIWFLALIVILVWNWAEAFEDLLTR